MSRQVTKEEMQLVKEHVEFIATKEMHKKPQCLKCICIHLKWNWMHVLESNVVNRYQDAEKGYTLSLSSSALKNLLYNTIILIYIYVLLVKYPTTIMLRNFECHCIF